MKNIWTLIYYEWLLFRKEKGGRIFAFLILATGFYSIYAGNNDINRQRQRLAHIKVLQEENIMEMKAKFPDSTDAGNIAYYHASFAVHYPDSWAPLATGQRDVYPAYLKLRLLALQNQLYNSENTNPFQLAAGSFDLAFVFVYLFPLFIIAISFNIISGEKERGTLSLLLSQPVSLQQITAAKLLFRLGIVIALLLLLTMIAVWWTAATPDHRLLYWLLAIILYCLFWLALIFLIVSLRSNSSFNAVVLLGVWLLLTIIIPVLINILASQNKPLPQGLELTIRQREEVHAGWDRPKAETMEKFYVRYPQWKGSAAIQPGFTWSWYFAFQELGDQSVEQLASTYRNGLQEKQQYTYRLGLLSAPATLQHTLNAIAGTDLQQHLAFLQSVEKFHAAMKAFYYPFLYRNMLFTHADYKQEPVHYYQSAPDYPIIYKGLLALTFSTILLFSAGSLIFNKYKVDIKC
jgi:ABC-2 type transport system permease protein